jgi:aspartate/methionine/tyrosine aminotransferase
MMDYASLLSEKVKGLKPSAIRKFFDILEEMDNAISLGIGEPDFVTPLDNPRRGDLLAGEGLYKIQRATPGSRVCAWR